MPLFSYESFYSSWLQTSYQPYLKLKLSSCTNYWIQQKSSNTITGRSHSIGAINFTTQDFNRLMQLRPFYFDIQINASPWFAAQKTLASHVTSVPRICKLQQIISQCHSIYDLSAILQALRLAVFTTHLKFVVLVPLVFSQFYNIQNTLESFDYTNFSEYGIK